MSPLFLFPAPVTNAPISPKTLPLSWTHIKGPQRTDPPKPTAPSIPTWQFVCRSSPLYLTKIAFPGLAKMQEERSRTRPGPIKNSAPLSLSLLTMMMPPPSVHPGRPGWSPTASCLARAKTTPPRKLGLTQGPTLLVPFYEVPR